MFLRNQFCLEDAAPVAAPVVDTVAPEIKFVKLKVNNTEREIAEDKIHGLAQLGLSATEKFTEAKKMREEAESILQANRTDKSAMKALERAGFSKQEAKAIIEEELSKLYEEDEMSPEDKSKRDEQAELKKYREQEAEKKKLIEDEQYSKEEQADIEQINDEIADAIEECDLPRNPILGKWALNYMSAYARQGEELSAKDAMKMVSGDMKEIIKDMLGGMDSASVKKFLKDEHLKGFIDENVASIQSRQPFNKPAVALKPVAKPEENVNKIMSWKQFDQLRGR
jgi:hypothetical protein